MKNRSIILVMVLALITFAAQATNKNPKPVISNYTEVLKTIEYPDVCRQNGVEGTVYVRISVDKKGNMSSYEIVKTPCSDLQKAVEDVLPDLKFQPAVHEGVAVNSKILIPIEFRLTY